MEVFQIKALDCAEELNRKKLLKETMKVVKKDEKPSTEFLEKFAKNIGEKYDMPIQVVKYVKSGMFISYRYDKMSYDSFTCRSYYEALCKYILLIKATLRFRKLQVT